MYMNKMNVSIKDTCIVVTQYLCNLNTNKWRQNEI